MKFLGRLNNIHSRELIKYIWTAGLAFAAIALMFFGYYYKDRYVRVDDKSPLDISIDQLEIAVRENPENPEARVALAEFYLGKGLYSQAIEQTDQVLSTFPENTGALLISGITYTRSGQSQKAIAPLEKFIDLRKDDPMAMSDTALQTAYYFLGESYNTLDQADKALPALEAALKINSTDADALFQAGLSSQTMNDHKKAIEFFDRAVLFVPDFTEAYAGMIESYTALNKPDHTDYARGMQAFSLKDYKTAQKYLESAREALPDFSSAHFGLALTYEQLNRLDDALISIKIALQLDPNNFSLQQVQERIEAAIKAQG
ncbi:tetratricopeptide repeat protein [Candidatus Villigracilis saccharophilus]|uniref:tetratricopeptide repeat protein n=1 Tax=Candidatus Villigracilis saccharophilus TaxID=3140684 RepID=UPI003134DE3E|nr:tetratricopeptide repeat protein [Anaerolineales bacterium]